MSTDPIIYKTPPRTGLEVYEMLPEGTLAELIENNIVMSPAPTYGHQDVLTEITVAVRSYVKGKGLGSCVVSPVDVYLDSNNVVQPDILFIATGRMHIIQEGKVKGAPDLIIEVISKGNQNHDRQTKKSLYERFGVQEYFIVEPNTKEVIGYSLQNGRYQSLDVETAVISSALLQNRFSF